MKTFGILFLLFIAVFNLLAASIAIYKGIYFLAIVFFAFTLCSVNIAKNLQ